MRRTVRALLILATFLAACRSRPPYEGKSVAELEGLLRKPDLIAQAQGAYGLSLLGPGALDALPALIDAMKSPGALVRQNAALAIGKIGPGAKAAVPALIEGLADSEWTVRRQSADSLGEIGEAGARPCQNLRN